MKLLLDIGNTRIKWGYLAAGGLQQPGEWVHRGKDAQAISEFVRQLPERPEQAAAVNVAGNELEEQIATALKNECGVQLQCLRTEPRWGEVRNAYADHTQLGADRWAAIVGAYAEYQTDLCVVDAGTAVTIDWIRADGRHLGGFILAGRQLAQAALRGTTADIEDFARRHAEPDPGLRPGASTHEAILRGADFGLCAAIDRAAQDAEAIAGLASRPLLVLTGGDAEILLPLLGTQARFRPQLVLEGVACLAGWR